MSPETKDPFGSENTGTSDPFSSDLYSHVDAMSYSKLQTYAKELEKEYNLDIKRSLPKAELKARIKEVLSAGKQDVEKDGENVGSDGEE